MREFLSLLRSNRNCRCAWMGQVVSEVGDHFNNIAVIALAMAMTQSAMVVTFIMLARAIPAILVGPLAGVLLDRFDRKSIMIASDLARAVLALGFILALSRRQPWLLYLFSALLMAASPFFTAGRSAILPEIARRDELHTANSLMQTTQWTTLTAGTFLGGAVVQFGYAPAFIFNALSFLFSAWAVSNLRAPEGYGFRARRARAGSDELALKIPATAWREYGAGLCYMRSAPLVLAIALASVGWATGGGAAQILFTLFGEVVFKRGAAGISVIWGCAALGLLTGAAFAHWLGKRLVFQDYKRIVFIDWLVHGSAYVLFSQMQRLDLALVFITVSRAAMAINSVLNYSYLLRCVPDQYRGRVFVTIETFTWATMMLSMLGAGIAASRYSPRTIGAVAGLFSCTTAIFWGWANWTGRLTQLEVMELAGKAMETHGEQV
jgi:MFS family permease